MMIFAQFIAVFLVVLPLVVIFVWEFNTWRIKSKASLVPVAFIEGGDHALLSPLEGTVVFSGSVLAGSSANTLEKAGCTIGGAAYLAPGEYTNITIIGTSKNKHVSSLSVAYPTPGTVWVDGKTCAPIKIPRAVRRDLERIPEWFRSALGGFVFNPKAVFRMKDRIIMTITIGGENAQLKTPADYGDVIGRPIIANSTGDIMVDVYLPAGWKTPLGEGDAVDMNSFLAYR